MDASSVLACCSSGSPDEATTPLPLSSSSLPPSHYLQTCPHLLTSSSPTNPPSADPVAVADKPEVLSAASCCSLNLVANDSGVGIGGDYRRQSLKNEAPPKVPDNSGSGSAGEPDLTSSSRSTSSPQLMSVKPRSKVYRRASLKSLTNIAVVSPAQSRIIRVSSRSKNEKRSLVDSKAKSVADDDDKENVVCSPLSNPYPYSTPCQKSNSGKPSNELCEESQSQRDEEKQAKSKICGSFLPILSLIPHTVISFQYPSPKMKFSWWRNKIS